MSDGSVFTAGGTRFVLDVNTNASYIAGLPYATTFDGQNWVRVPADMQAVGTLGTNSRWYTTVTRLPDERLLVTSGYELVYPIPVPHLSAEVFDPATGNWQVVSPLGQPPMEIFNSDYTHTFVLPNPIGPYELLMFGEAGEPVFFGPTCSNPWVVSSQPRPNTQAGEVPNNGASTALLPIRLKDGAWGYANGSVIVAVGAPGTSHQRKLDVYDPVQDAWLGRIDMGVPRHHPVTVNLPDGRMLVVGGHAKLPYPGLRFANYLDPAKSFVFERGTAAMGEVRGYHTVALLLPDGRVLVGGGRGLNTADSKEKSRSRYLYPPYMFRPRPKLLYAPPAIGYGSAFPVVTKGRPVQAVLVGLGAMTHSFDFNQRHVQLEVTRRRAPQPVGARMTLLRAPSDPRIAPPGVYMLFVLNARRTPSQAAIVRLL